MRFARLDRAPAYKIVSDAILKDIIGGRLRMGNRLPSEQKLAEQFGVNRSTVREGIRLLEETGVLRREFGKRLVVSRPSYDSVGGRIGRAMILHEVTFRELWETIMAIEPAHGCARSAQAAAADLDLIAGNIARTRVSLADGQVLVTLDIEVSQPDRASGCQSGDRAGAGSAEPIDLSCVQGGLVDGGASAAGPRLLAAHEAIAQAITDSDIETTWKWMERHISDFRKGYEMFGFNIDTPLQSAGAS